MRRRRDGISAVGINDDLSACQSAVACRTADHKASCGVDQDTGVFVEDICRYHRGDDVFYQVAANLFDADMIVMLRRDQNGVDPDRTVVFVIFHRDLCFAVGTEIGDGVIFADICQAFC